jgi:hypothetical protein
MDTGESYYEAVCQECLHVLITLQSANPNKRGVYCPGQERTNPGASSEPRSVPWERGPVLLPTHLFFSPSSFITSPGTLKT